MGGEVSAYMNNGIVNPGTSVTRVCVSCKKEFETQTGVVTIKGPCPEQTQCKLCHQREQEALFKELAKSMSKEDR